LTRKWERRKRARFYRSCRGEEGNIPNSVFEKKKEEKISAHKTSSPEGKKGSQDSGSVIIPRVLFGEVWRRRKRTSEVLDPGKEKALLIFEEEEKNPHKQKRWGVRPSGSFPSSTGMRNGRK